MSFVGYHHLSPYLVSPALFADDYDFTMPIVDFLEGDIEEEVVSQITFRERMNSGVPSVDSQKPNKIPFYMSAGLEPWMQSLSRFGFTAEDLEEMAEETILGTDKKRFPKDLLKYWADPEKQKLRVTITAREEGRLLFPHEPAIVIKGPKWQVDMLEVTANNLMRNATKTATIATQFWLAAESPSGRRPLLIEGGARRSSDWLGLNAARSAYLAGWDSTSNRFARKIFGVPTKGSVAHSFYMAAKDEITANRKWMRHMPAASLPDSRNTWEGMDIHLQVCKEMGVHPASARNDSDDPKAFVEEYARKMREYGFDPDKVNFIASNSLGIMEIYKLTHIQDLPYNAFIIGTNIANHVYDSTESPTMKLAQVTGMRDGKLVEEPRAVMKIAKGKASFPGEQQTLHMYEERDGQPDLFKGSVIAPVEMELGKDGRLNRELISKPLLNEEGRIKLFPEGTKYRDPNVLVMEEGRPVRQVDIDQDSKKALQLARGTFFETMESLHPQHKALVSPVPIGFGAEKGLFDHRQDEIEREDIRSQRLNADRRRTPQPV